MISEGATPKAKLYEKLAECADLLTKMAEEPELDTGTVEGAPARQVINIDALRKLVPK